MNYKLAQKKLAELAEAETAARRATSRAEKLRLDLKRFFGGEVASVKAPTSHPKRSAPKAKKKLAVMPRVAKHNPVRVPPAATHTARTPHVVESTGTRLNDVLRVLHSLGGHGPLKEITKRVPNDANRDSAAHGKLVRGCLSYLRTKGKVASIKRGLWQITPAGQAAIGMSPQTEIGSMFPKQEGHA